MIALWCSLLIGSPSNPNYMSIAPSLYCTYALMRSRHIFAICSTCIHIPCSSNRSHGIESTADINQQMPQQCLCSPQMAYTKCKQHLLPALAPAHTCNFSVPDDSFTSILDARLRVSLTILTRVLPRYSNWSHSWLYTSQGHWGRLTSVPWYSPKERLYWPIRVQGMLHVHMQRAD